MDWKSLCSPVICAPETSGSVVTGALCLRCTESPADQSMTLVVDVEK